MTAVENSVPARRDVATESETSQTAETVPGETSAHVAFYIPSLDVGGAQRVTITVANGLAASGYDVDLVVSYRRGSLRESVADNVRLVDLDTPSVPVVGIGASAPGLRSYLEREEPDVFFSAMTYATFVVMLATMRLDVETTIVGIEHNRFDRDLGIKAKLVAWAAGRIYPATDHVLAVSNGVAESVLDGTRLDTDSVSVQHNPVEVEEINETAREPVDHEWFADEYETIVSVGRLELQKEYSTLIRAFALLHERRPQTRLIIAGTGSKRDELLELAADLGVDDYVSLPGYVENAYAYMYNASVFALSSRNEGLPTVVIEALACGCPIVSTDCPSGPREILEDGVYGPLVPVGDSEALADAIEATLDDPPSREVQRARAADFSAPKAVAEYAALVDSWTDRDEE